MADGRDVMVGRDAFGNAMVTGDNNLTFVLMGVDRVPDDLLAALRSGRVRPADLPGAVPLAALTVAFAVDDAERRRWRVTTRRAVGEPTVRTMPAPWRDDRAVAAALQTFQQLGGQRLETRDEYSHLAAAADRIGDALAGVLGADERAFLIAAARGDPPPPLLVVESDEDEVLGLPWELLRLDGRFAVQAGRLDVARSVPSVHAPVLATPSAPVNLLVNISAPEGSGLNYERESYFIVGALHAHLGMVINEMGEVRGRPVDRPPSPPSLSAPASAAA
jgi:hypothetical protein